MKPLQGPTRSRAKNDPIPEERLSHRSEYRGQDTEGRVGEALGRPPFQQSRERVSDPSPALFLDPDEILRNIRSWPHLKDSEPRPSVSTAILSLEEKTGVGRGGPFSGARQHSAESRTRRIGRRCPLPKGFLFKKLSLSKSLTVLYNANHH